MREKMVTRTIETICGNGVFMDTKTRQIISKDIQIPCDIPEKKKSAYINANFGGENLVFIMIDNEHTVTTLYGMPESEFIKLSKVLPPRKVAEE